MGGREVVGSWGMVVGHGSALCDTGRHVWFSVTLLAKAGPTHSPVCGAGSYRCGALNKGKAHDAPDRCNSAVPFRFVFNMPLKGCCEWLHSQGQTRQGEGGHRLLGRPVLQPRWIDLRLWVCGTTLSHARRYKWDVIYSVIKSAAGIQAGKLKVSTEPHDLDNGAKSTPGL